MNIFSALAKYAQNKIGKLMYDTDGNAYLYDTNTNEFKDITIYPQEKFRPYVNFDWRDRGRDEKIKKWKDSFDNIRVYSVKVGEEVIDGENKPILRYGFINEKGYAITHATYDRVEAFQNGYARVYVKEHYCNINRQGHPMMDGKPFYKAEFVFNVRDGFIICCTDGKYGLINKYHYQCIPCEYDSLSLLPIYESIKNWTIIPSVWNGIDVCAVMKKNSVDYVAILEGNSVCNIISNLAPKSVLLSEKFLVIEEEVAKDNETLTKKGLLNRGGIRILNSEYDSIEIVASNIGIVTKGNLKQLLFIGEKGFKVYIDSCEDIKYGEAYDEERGIKYCYASVNDHEIIYLEYEDKEGLHSMENYRSFCIDDIFDDNYDRLYFSYNGKPNNYIAVVYGDKTKLVDIWGNEIMPLAIPSTYYVLTDTYGEGLVGICLDGNRLFKECSFINSEGKVLTGFSYYRVDKFENGKAKVYYSNEHISVTEVIDKEGNILERESEPNCSCPPDDTWADMIDDAYEGDPDARWNTD